MTPAEEAVTPTANETLSEVGTQSHIHPMSERPPPDPEPHRRPPSAETEVTPRESCEPSVVNVRNALSAFALSHSKSLYRIAYSRTRREDVADAIVADTYYSIATSPQAASFATWEEKRQEAWANKILSRRVADYFRAETRSEGVIQRLSRHASRATPDIADGVAERMTFDALLSCFPADPPKLRTALICYYSFGRTPEEIAQLLNVNESTVKNWIFRKPTTKKIRNAVEALLHEGP